MTAVGTVTLSEIKKTTTTPLIHRYTRLLNGDHFERFYFDTSMFFNTEEYTMNYGEQHQMLIEGSNPSDALIYPAKRDEQSLAIDLDQEPSYLCFAVTLESPGVSLTVGPNTSLALLLKSAQFEVTLFGLTNELLFRLKQPLVEHELARNQVNMVRQAALNLLHSRDPRRKRTYDNDS